MDELQWSRTTPTQPGWYGYYGSMSSMSWFSYAHFAVIELVEKNGTLWIKHQDEELNKLPDKAYWCGPIEFPPLPDSAPLKPPWWDTPQPPTPPTPGTEEG